MTQDMINQYADYYQFYNQKHLTDEFEEIYTKNIKELLTKFNNIFSGIVAKAKNDSYDDWWR